MRTCFLIKWKQEMFVKHVCPLRLNVTVTFDLETPYSIVNRGHLLIMPNHHTKLDPWAISSLVIDWTRFVYGQTDRPTDRPTFAKQYTPTSLKGVIINMLKLIRCICQWTKIRQTCRQIISQYMLSQNGDRFEDNGFLINYCDTWKKWAF